jgi:hypothetical protein
MELVSERTAGVIQGSIDGPFQRHSSYFILILIVLFVNFMDRGVIPGTSL